MRLLYVCSDFGVSPDGTKGASIHLRSICDALGDLGHDVQLLSARRFTEYRRFGSDYLATEGRVLVEDVGRMVQRWLAQHELRSSLSGEIRSVLFNAWALEHVPARLSENPPDAIIERLSLFGHVGLDLATALHVPLVLEVNAPITREATDYRSLQMKSLAAEIEQRVLQGADEIIVVSTELADELSNRGVSRRKIHVVPNGVHVQDFDGLPNREICRERLGFGDEFVVGFVGSLKTWHGVDMLVSAFEKVLRNDPSARLVVVGSGPAAAALEDQVERLGLEESVRFTGAVDHREVPAMIRAMDVAVAPFKNVDGFYFSPIKLFEYMAAGVCVVASRLGQIAEVIEDGLDGLLCRPDDVEALAERIEEARRSKVLREQLGARAAQKVRDHYTWSRAAKTTSEVVSVAIDRKKSMAQTSPHRGIACVADGVLS
ncbi:MAG: glycosyltransferase family 4 protein [Planctomycetota bacterium]